MVLVHGRLALVPRVFLDPVDHLAHPGEDAGFVIFSANPDERRCADERVEVVTVHLRHQWR